MKFYEKAEISDTLELQCYNEPYKRVFLDLQRIEKVIEKTNKEAEKHSVFTESDRINFVSNGIDDRFFVDETSDKIKTINKTVLVFKRFFKKNNKPIDSDYDGPVSVGEISKKLEDYGILEYLKVFDNLVKKTKYPESNLISYKDMKEMVFENNSFVEVSSLQNIVSDITDNSAITQDIVKKLYLTKETKDGLKVKVSSIYPQELSANIIEAQDVVFNEDSVFESNCNISIKKATEELYKKNENIRSGIEIINPSLFSPANKKEVDKFSDYLLKNNSPIFNSLKINRNKVSFEDLDDKIILMREEAEAIIDSFFKNIISPKIENIKDYKELISNSCAAQLNDFIKKDFSIEGGKIYLSFDYDNMYSVLNNEAIKQILFDYNEDVNQETPVTLKTKSYMRDFSVVSSFNSIVELLGYKLNIEKDSIAKTFEVFQKVICDISSLRISKVMETPEILPALPEMATSIDIKPILLKNFNTGYIESFYQVPTFFKTDENLLVQPPIFISPKTNISSENTYFNKNIDIPIYNNKYQELPIISPELQFGSKKYQNNIFTLSQSAAIIKAGAINNSMCSVDFYSASEQSNDIAVVCKTSTGNNGRILGISSRQINYIDANVAINKAIGAGLAKFLITSKRDGCVLHPAKSVVKIVSDVFCEASETINSSVSKNLTFENFLKSSLNQTQTGENRNSSLKCGYNGNALDRASSLSIIIDGEAVVDGYGNSIGNSRFKDSELLHFWQPPHIEEWMAIDSAEYVAAIKSSAFSLSSSINGYFSGRIYDEVKDDLTRVRSSEITDMDEIISGSNQNKMMREYLRFTDLSDVNKKIQEETYWDLVSLNMSGYGDDSRISVIRTKKPSAKAFEYIKGMGNSGFTEIKIIVDGPVVVVVSYLSNSLDEKGNQYIIYDLYTYKTNVSIISDADGKASGVMLSADGRNNNIVLKGSDKIGSVSSLNTVDCGKVGMDILTIDEINLGVRNDIVNLYDTPFAEISVDGGFSFGSNDSNGTDALEAIDSGTGFNSFVSELENQNSGYRYNIPSLATGFSSCFDDGLQEESTNKSGIDGTKWENISSTDYFDPNIPESKKNLVGEIPANLSFILVLPALYIAEENIIFNRRNLRIRSSMQNTFRIPISIGVIDGKKGDNGDILAQHALEIKDDNAEDIIYIHANGKTASFKEETDSHTVYEVKIKDLLGRATYSAKLPDGNIVDNIKGDRLPVLKRRPLSDDNYIVFKELGINILGPGNNISANSVNITDMLVSSQQFSIKHSGANPERPIITSFSGSQEISQVGGTFTSSINNAAPYRQCAGTEAGDNQFFTIIPNGEKIEFHILKTNPPLGGPGVVKVIQENNEQGE